MNPYGITQVDVPGLLSVYQGAQDRRAQQMLARRQQEAAEKQADRDQRFDEILAKGMGGVYGDQPQGGAMASVYPTPQGQGAPSAAPQPAMQRPQAFQLDPQTAAQLIALDPKQASEIITAFGQMNEQQHKASQRVNDTLGRAAQYLLGVPEQARGAELQRIAPDLVAQGIDPQQIAGFQPTNQALEFMVAQSRDVEKLREEFLPDPYSVDAGASIIDRNALRRGEQPEEIYRSPFVRGEGGVMYERVPNAPQGGGQSATELQAQADEAIRRGADPAAVNARLRQMLGGGGGGNATGNFPRR